MSHPISHWFNACRVAESGLDVFAHNIETVERLTPGVRDPRARYGTVNYGQYSTVFL